MAVGPSSNGTATPPRTSGRPCDQPVQVVAGADPHAASGAAQVARASARSSVVVIFTLRGSPSTSVHRVAGALGQHRFVGGVEAVAARGRARDQHVAAEHLRRLREVDALARNRRLDDRTVDAVASELDGVATGSAAIAAPCARGRRRSPRSISAAVTNGRAASWISTARRPRPPRRRRCATESWRRAPPATQPHRAAARSAQVVRRIGERRLRQRDHHLRDARVGGEGVQRAGQHRPAGEVEELLGAIGAQPQPEAAGGDHRADRHLAHPRCRPVSCPPTNVARRAAVASTMPASAAGVVRSGA